MKKKEKHKPVVSVVFTHGFGNNIFQYVFARLLAKKHNAILSHPSLDMLGIKENKVKLDKKIDTIVIKTQKTDDGDYGVFFRSRKKPVNFKILTGYFEDYEIYSSYLEEIRSWFPSVGKTNNKDLVIHMRLGNRLVQETSFRAFIKPESYKKAFEQFKFDRLHVVTDLEKWDNIDEEYICNLHKRVNDHTTIVPISRSIDYISGLVSCFREFDTVIHHNEDFIDDFNIIRSFNNILVHNSTFAWWAAVLSKAENIGVFSPWKPYKASRNKNLGKTNYQGWFGWGNEDDFI